MITLDLAQRLRAAGVEWEPVVGDRFMVPDRGMDSDVFLISDMVVEAHDVPTGRILRFNGTTEWALDSVEEREVVWLPREDQLRHLLGDRFVRLEATPGASSPSCHSTGSSNGTSTWTPSGPTPVPCWRWRAEAPRPATLSVLPCVRLREPAAERGYAR